MENQLVEVIQIRKKIANILKKAGCNYFYDKYICQAYNGDGFYINHREKTTKRLNIWGADISWAYGGALKQYKFPTSSILSNLKTELGIYIVEYKYMIKKYKDFYYTLFDNNSLKNGDKYIMFMSNIDWEIFTDLYETDAVVIGEFYFQDIDYLPQELFDMVDEYYIKKKLPENKDKKAMFEACFYGMNAKLLNPDMILKRKGREATPYEINEYNMAYEEINGNSEHPFLNIRSKYTPIAIFQTSYLRKKEWEMFKKYKDNVVYMNTDSVLLDKDIKIDGALDHKELGQYYNEYHGELAQFIRRNAYIIFNKDMSIKEQVIGGIPEELTKLTLKDCNDLLDEKKDYTIKCKSYLDNTHKKTIDVKLTSNFIKMFQGSETTYGDLRDEKNKNIYRKEN